MHTTQVVEMHDSGIDAVRKKKDSSVSRAVDLVKSSATPKRSSAPETPVPLLRRAMIKLRMLPGIDRPAIAAMMPTERGRHFVLCDAGANPDPTSQQPAEGQRLHGRRSIANRSSNVPIPLVGLLSNGAEEFKGNALTLATHGLLKASGLNFHGNIEGHDLAIRN